MNKLILPTQHYKMKFILIAATLFVAITTTAQKIDKEDCGNHAYIQTPSDLALQELTTYMVTASVPNNNGYSVATAKNATNLEGFTKTTSPGAAEFTVNYTVFPLSFTRAEYKLTKSEYEKDGVKKVSYSHSYESSYSFRVDVQILDQAGMEIYQNSSSGSNTIYKSSSKSATAAKDLHNREVKNVKGTRVKNTIEGLNKKMNERFATMSKTFNLRVTKIKPKKYDYDGFNAATESLKSLANITDQAEKNTICEEAIALWNEDLYESAPDERKARVNKKVTAAAYYNIAHAYFVMGDYQKSFENFEKAQEFDKSVTMLHETKKEHAQDMAERKVLQGQ